MQGDWNPVSRNRISYLNQGVPFAGKLDGTARSLVLAIQLFFGLWERDFLFACEQIPI